MKVERLTDNVEDFTGEVWYIQEAGVLVDAGTGDSWQKIKELDNVDAVLITHSHYDHIDNLKNIVEEFSPEVYAFEPDNLNVEAEKISEGEKLEANGTAFEVFHTPGHKNDSVCFYVKPDKLLFAGDLIFSEGSFGRTDLEEGDRDILINSIQKIDDLDVKRMYTGHGEAVTENTNQNIEKSLEEARKHESKY